MTGFTPAAVHNPSIAVTAVRRPFLLLSNIFFLIFLFHPWHLFTITNGCILLYSVDKIHPSYHWLNDSLYFIILINIHVKTLLNNIDFSFSSLE